MSREDVEFVLPNLADLRNALNETPDVVSLLTAFDAESLVNARQALRQVAGDWAKPGNRLNTVGPSADEVSA